MNRVSSGQRVGRYSAVVAGAVGAAIALAWNAFPSNPNADPDNEQVVATQETAAPNVAALVGAATAATTTLPPLADVIERVKPSVVTITAEKGVRGMTPFGGPNSKIPPGQVVPGSPLEEFMERFFGPGGPGGRQGPQAAALGSGFVVDAEGFIVTNHHVISGADSLTVTFEDGKETSAEVIGVDEATDLAVIKVKADNLRAVAFGDSDRARVGDWVIAIGNPFGFGGTATVGIISARGRDLRAGPYDDFLQIDAAINSGNSGGPIFNQYGEVIGVNTAIYSPNGGNVGLGFAIPAAQARSVIQQLREGGSVKRGYLGVQIQELSDELAASMGLDNTDGALVADVLADSPAARAGVLVGDVVLAFNGKPIKDARDLSRLVAGSPQGEEATLAIVRDGNRRSLAVNLGELTPNTSLAGTDSANPTPSAGPLGVELATLDANTRNRFGVPDHVQGVLITDVEIDSPAAEQGLRPGDVIVMVNQQPVRSPASVREAVDAARAAKRGAVSMLIQRGNNKQFVAIELR